MLTCARGEGQAGYQTGGRTIFHLSFEILHSLISYLFSGDFVDRLLFSLTTVHEFPKRHIQMPANDQMEDVK